MYRSVYYSYPNSWQQDMYPSHQNPGAFDFGPPEFNIDIQTTVQYVGEYGYRYSPVPAGCQDNGNSSVQCVRYTLTATPRKFQRTKESFFVDDIGVIRHCVGVGGADSSDALLEEVARPCTP